MNTADFTGRDGLLYRVQWWRLTDGTLAVDLYRRELCFPGGFQWIGAEPIWRIAP